MRVLFVGFSIPQRDFDQVMARDQAMWVQTQRFGWSVIEALTSAAAEVFAISAAPVSDFPQCSQLLFRGQTFTERGIDGNVLPFVNVIGLKHVTRYLAATRALTRAQRRGPCDVVVVHGVHSPFLWCGWRASRRGGIPLVVIMTDPPSQLHPFDTPLATGLKHIDKHLIRTALRRADGVIAVTQRLADDFAPGRPSMVLEGITAAAPMPVATEVSEQGPLVVYAGGLREDYGVAELLRAVEASTGVWRLVIYGGGPMEGTVRAAARVSDRIEYGGMVDPVRLGEVYKSATLLVNPRPPLAPFTEYSFPSKLLEYLAAGRPVLSTRLPSIPTEYEAFVYWSEADGASLAASIDLILAEPAVVLQERGRAGQQFATQLRSPAAQGRRIRRFVESLPVRG